MLNTDIKKQINTARDILVGKIPDPKGQIDQITNALIYKFMDDQDRLAETLPGGKASFFVNGLSQYAWHKLFDSKLSNQDRANLYIEGIEKLSKAKHLPELFQDIFKDAFLPFRASDTIAMFLNEINKFDYHHSEDLGNAFEYLLSIMGSQGDAGQFRTPRNIIEFIVDAVDPQKDETILDPACGTAGFLIEVYKHITEKENLSQSDIQKLGKNITGIDIDPGMAKIARVNLYLHGFKTPQISEDDSLSNENTWGKKYDVILANPPFMTPKGGIKPHDKFTIQSKRAEVLFTDYIAEHLKLAGRAGIVVPEGIIFQGSNTYKQLRKMLVDDGYLWGVVSLPAGVFNPYSGVKTSILLLDRQRASEVEEIMFYKVDKDGFDLGAQRREIKDNDLPEALEVINAWRDGKKLEKEKALFIPKVKLAEDGDYNLSIDRYKVTIDHSAANWPIVKLEEVCDIYQPKTITSKEINEEGDYKVFGANGVIGYYDKYNHEEPEVAITCRGATCGTVNLTESFSWITGNAMVVTPKEDFLNKEFLFYTLREADFSSVITGAAQPQITKSSLSPLKIPLPPLEVQEQIVAELDGYQTIIDGAQKVVDNWKPKIEIDPEWERLTIADMVEGKLIEKPLDGNHGSIHPKSSDYVDEGIPFVMANDLKNGIVDIKNTNKISAIQAKGLKKGFAINNDVLLTHKGTIGRTAILKSNYEFVVLTPQVTYYRVLNEKRVINKYLKYYFDTELFQADLRKYSGAGATRAYIGITDQLKLIVYLPSIDIQEKIISEIEAEKQLVESTKQLIKIHEDKIKKVVDGLWGE